MTSLYGLVPVYTVYLENLHVLSDSIRAIVVGGASVVLVIVLQARAKGHRLFVRHDKKDTR